MGNSSIVAVVGPLMPMYRAPFRAADRERLKSLSSPGVSNAFWSRFLVHLYAFQIAISSANHCRTKAHGRILRRQRHVFWGLASFLQ
jgi:hypothetical protein